jgi:hypothetical protein
MKKLVLIGVCGIAGVLLLSFAAQAGFNMLQGRPIAHATGIQAVILRDFLVFIVVAVSVLAYWIWTWYDPENLLAHFVRWWKSR